MMTPRPTALVVNVAGGPAALRAERRWVMWRYELRAENRWAKLPCTVTGRHAETDNSATWTTFDAAMSAYRAGGFDGIGFCLGDGWAGIDVDDYHTDAWPLLNQLPGYRETSPSGTGLKIIGRAARIGGEIKFDLHAAKPPVFTPWTGARYFTVTGQDASGDPLADLSGFIDEWFRAPVLNLSSTREGYTRAAETSDDDLLVQMAGADNGDRFIALWRGDASAYGGDRSRADQALCCHLAFWTNFDADRIDRLFRLSGLMREKWNATSYRRSTLQKALR